MGRGSFAPSDVCGNHYGSSASNSRTRRKERNSQDRVVLGNQLFKLISGRRASRNERDKLSAAAPTGTSLGGIGSSAVDPVNPRQAIEHRVALPRSRGIPRRSRMSNLGQRRLAVHFPAISISRPSQFCPPLGPRLSFPPTLSSNVLLALFRKTGANNTRARPPALACICPFRLFISVCRCVGLENGASELVSRSREHY